MDEREHRRKVEAVFRKHDADNSGTILERKSTLGHPYAVDAAQIHAG